MRILKIYWKRVWARSVNTGYSNKHCFSFHNLDCLWLNIILARNTSEKVIGKEALKFGESKLNLTVHFELGLNWCSREFSNFQEYFMARIKSKKACTMSYVYTEGNENYMSVTHFGLLSLFLTARNVPRGAFLCPVTSTRPMDSITILLAFWRCSWNELDMHVENISATLVTARHPPEPPRGNAFIFIFRRE